MSKSICIVTGSRAEYGLLSRTIKFFHDDPDVNTQIIVTGMHLSPEYGLTYREIEGDGFKINKKIEMLLSSDTAVGISKSIGLGIIGFADSFNELKPDLLLVVGDRFEILAAVTAAAIARIPVAHIHGGEITEGAVDDLIRHAITKMSHLHFVATEEYMHRVIQMGEQKDSVFNVGGLGVDMILDQKYPSKEELERLLGIKFLKKNLLVTFHPETAGNESSEYQINEILIALESLDDTMLMFTLPNSDAGSSIIKSKIISFCSTKKNSYFKDSLGHKNYLSLMRYVDGVIGNSSSGLLEAPTFKIGTINIGLRQKGRILSESIISCRAEVNSLKSAIKFMYSIEYQKKLKSVVNPYGNGGASHKIYSIIKDKSLKGLNRKSFYDFNKF